MKKNKSIFMLVATIFLIGAIAKAESDLKNLVQGTINGYNKDYVFVTDTLGQKLKITKSAIPKKVKIESGQFISIEVADDQLMSGNSVESK